MTLADDVKVSWWNFGDVKVYFFKPEGSYYFNCILYRYKSNKTQHAKNITFIGFAKEGPGEAMLYFHGGGWTVGSVGTKHKITLKIKKYSHLVNTII